MTKQEELKQLQSRQVALLTTMSKSDARAAKCSKLGKKFQTQYPDDYAEYVAANEEYQAVEARIAEIEAEMLSEGDRVLAESEKADAVEKAEE